MMIVSADSMAARYLEKPVLASRVLDDMEADRPWRVYGTGRIEYVRNGEGGGRRALRLRVLSRDEEWIAQHRRPDGSFDGSLLSGAPSAVLQFASPQDWTAFNRISLRVYVHPADVENYVLAVRFTDRSSTRGGPTDIEPLHWFQDIQPGRWNHLVWEIPEIPRKEVVDFHITQPLRGAGAQTVELVCDIDAIELQRVDAEPYAGWTVADGRIAFDHLGYQPGDEKIAVAGDTDDTNFRLLRDGVQTVRLPVRRQASAKGAFNVLDFSGEVEPGEYRLQLGNQMSRPFRIADDVWLPAVAKTLNFFYCLRCGFPVPGCHGDCHQDVTVTFQGATRRINGGWHDAGDTFNFAARTHTIVRALLELHHQLAANGVAPDLEARALEEASWGLEWELKIRFGQGYRCAGFQTRFFSNNRIGDADDVSGMPVSRQLGDNLAFAAAAGYAGWSLKEATADLAARCLAAAVEDYQAVLPLADAAAALSRADAANGVLASLELYRATGAASYRDRAVRFGRTLVDCQETRFVDGAPIAGYFYETSERRAVVHENHSSAEQLPMMALWRLCEALPDEADWIEWYAAVVIYSEYFATRGAGLSAPYHHLPNGLWSNQEVASLIARVTSSSPGGGSGVTGGRPPPMPASSLAPPPGAEHVAAQIQALFEAGVAVSPNHRLKTFPIWNPMLGQGTFVPFRGGSQIQLAGAAAVMASAQLRRSAPLDRLAKKQIHWVLGANPFSQSLIYGAGHDFQPHWAGLFAGMVGSVPVGMDSIGDEPFWPAANQMTFKEQWGEAAAKFLWTLAYAAMPALVEGEAGIPAVFIDAAGRRRRVGPGPFRLVLPSGTCQVDVGGVMRPISLVGGERRRLVLDPANYVALTLTTETVAAGLVQMTATGRGAGRRRLALRLFNGEGPTEPRVLEASPGRAGTASWTFAIADPARPWVAVVVPDGGAEDRLEAFGVHSEAPAMPSA